jgi:hypothetical protein
MLSIKQLIKLFLPPVFISVNKKLLPKQKKYSWFGDYKTWNDAIKIQPDMTKKTL